MPRKIFTPEQIIRKLREAGVLIAKGMTAQQGARQISSGIYIYQLKARKFTQTKRMLLIK